jgi:hypothetical protein
MKIAISVALLSLAIGAGSVRADHESFHDHTGAGSSTCCARGSTGHWRCNGQEGDLQGVQRSGYCEGSERQGAEEIPFGLQEERWQGSILSLVKAIFVSERAGTVCRLFYFALG